MAKRLETYQRMAKIQNAIPHCAYRVDQGMLHLPRFIEQFEVDLDPDYQRGYVWNESQKRHFVGAVIEHHHSIPVFWFNFIGSERLTSEVIDGKQRINAILGWIDGKYDAICPCGERFHASDLDEISRRNLGNNATLKMHFVELGKADVMRYYLLLNAGGTVHATADLEKVRKALAKEKGKDNG